MTHDKKLLDVKRSFSPVSLKDAERFAQLEKTLELVIMQDGKGYLPESILDNREWDQTVSPAIRKTTPNDCNEHRLWILGLRLSMPCV